MFRAVGRRRGREGGKRGDGSIVSHRMMGDKRQIWRDRGEMYPSQSLGGDMPDKSARRSTPSARGPAPGREWLACWHTRLGWAARSPVSSRDALARRTQSCEPVPGDRFAFSSPSAHTSSPRIKAPSHPAPTGATAHILFWNLSSLATVEPARAPPSPVASGSPPAPNCNTRCDRSGPIVRRRWQANTSRARLRSRRHERRMSQSG